jgi:Fe-S oxidoreductase
VCRTGDNVVLAASLGQACALVGADVTLDFDACTKCGRCHSVCPARTAGAPLSPRDLILDLRQWADRQNHIPAVLDREERPDETGPLLPAGVEIAGDVISERTLWSCTTCMACVEECPVGIEHVPTIVQLRRRLVDQGRMEPSLQNALQSIAQQGNSFGKSSRMRARWTKGLDFQVKDARKENVDLLWFVGDHASFDERMQVLSQALARILQRAGVDFGILYEDERNSGNDVRRVGEEGLFEMLVEHNIPSISKVNFAKLFTTDPHSQHPPQRVPRLWAERSGRPLQRGPSRPSRVEVATSTSSRSEAHLPRPVLPGKVQQDHRSSSAGHIRPGV